MKFCPENAAQVYKCRLDDLAEASLSGLMIFLTTRNVALWLPRKSTAR